MTDLQARADALLPKLEAWAWERWPSSHDYPERDAAIEAYRAALIAIKRRQA